MSYNKYNKTVGGKHYEQEKGCVCNFDSYVRNHFSGVRNNSD